MHHAVILKRGERCLPICQTAIIPGKAQVAAVTSNQGYSSTGRRGYGHGHSQSLAVIPMPREATMASRYHPLPVKDSIAVYRRRIQDGYDDDRDEDRPLGYHLDRDTNMSIRRWRSTAGARDDSNTTSYRDRVVPRPHLRHISHEDVRSSYGSSSDPSSSSSSSNNTYYYYASPQYGSGSDQSSRARRAKTGWWSRLF
jgi:hypothetical protein